MIAMAGGCLPSPRDERDYISTAAIAQDINVPSKKTWDVPLIRSQGTFGTCVGQGAACLKDVQETVQRDFPPGGFSPLFIYSICKERDGIPDTEGTYIRVAMQVLYELGIAAEKEFPYSLWTPGYPVPIVSSTLRWSVDDFKIASYARIPQYNLTALKQALNASPVVAGLTLHEDFYNPESGFLSTPSGAEIGGHCVLFCGYDDNLTFTYGNGVTRTGFIKLANSWGTFWGKDGYAYISYEDLYAYVFEAWSSIDLIVPNEYYRVQVGAFFIKENCQRLALQVKAAGFPIYLPPVGDDGIYRVQCGAYYDSGLAVALRDRLRAAGYDKAYVIYK